MSPNIPDHDGPRPWLATPLRRLAIAPFTLPIRAYRLTLSPFLGGQCRFEPTCSHYALDAYHTHGPLKGTRMTVWRLLRCQPFGKGGYDPVPPADRAAGSQVRPCSRANRPSQG